MTKNVGSIDRIVRMIAGIAVISWGVMYHNWWGAVGAVPILTVVMSWCPLYSIFGLSTCRTQESKPA